MASSISEEAEGQQKDERKESGRTDEIHADHGSEGERAVIRSTYEDEMRRLKAEEAKQQEEMERRYADLLKELAEMSDIKLSEIENETSQKKAQMRKEEKLEAERERINAELDLERQEKEDKEMKAMRAKKEKEFLEREKKLNEELQLKKQQHDYQLNKEEEEARNKTIKEQAQIESALREQKYLIRRELQTQKEKQVTDFVEKEKEAFAIAKEWKKELEQRQEEIAILGAIEENELKMEVTLQLKANKEAAQERVRQYTEEQKEQMREYLEDMKRKYEKI